MVTRDGVVTRDAPRPMQDLAFASRQPSATPFQQAFSGFLGGLAAEELMQEDAQGVPLNHVGAVHRHSLATAADLTNATHVLCDTDDTTMLHCYHPNTHPPSRTIMLKQQQVEARENAVQTQPQHQCYDRRFVRPSALPAASGQTVLSACRLWDRGTHLHSPLRTVLTILPPVSLPSPPHTHATTHAHTANATTARTHTHATRHLLVVVVYPFKLALRFHCRLLKQTRLILTVWYACLAGCQSVWQTRLAFSR